MNVPYASRVFTGLRNRNSAGAVLLVALKRSSPVAAACFLLICSMRLMMVSETVTMRPVTPLSAITLGSNISLSLGAIVKSFRRRISCRVRAAPLRLVLTDFWNET